MPTIQTAKVHLRVEHSEEDTYIQGLLDAALMQIENDTHQRITQAPQTLVLDCFEPEIELPIAPVIALVGITYFDEYDTQQTLTTDDWYLDTRPAKAILKPSFDTAWPLTSDKPQSV